MASLITSLLSSLLLLGALALGTGNLAFIRYPFLFLFLSLWIMCAHLQFTRSLPIHLYSEGGKYQAGVRDTYGISLFGVIVVAGWKHGRDFLG